MPDEQALERPPYLSFTTFMNFLDRWGDGPVPPRIDKSALDSYSGGTQAVLMGVLRLVGYVDQEGWVTPELRESVSDIGARKAYLAKWARQFYVEQVGLAEQGATAGMLHETFAAHGYTGSTLRKAVVFYLAMVEYLGLPSSPHFRPPKQSATPTNRKRATRTAPSNAPAATPEPELPASTPTSQGGETIVIRIADVATVTVNVKAQWMKMPVETITAMRQAIAQLEKLATASVGAGDEQ